MDRAAASGTTPRAPAHETTAGACHERWPVPIRLWVMAARGKTHATRTTIRVTAMAAAANGQVPWAAGRSPISTGSCRPMRANTTLSSRKMTVS